MTTEQMDTNDETRRREMARPGSFIPQTFEEAMRLSDQLAKSELVPTEFRDKPANIFVALQLGADLGLSPMQAMQSIAVFNGKPTLYGDVGLALALNSPLLESFEEWYDDTTQTAHCKVKRRGDYKEIERTFGKTDAERIQVWEKDRWAPLANRATYRSYPKRMYQMRARWWALRDAIPDVYKGIAGREEIEEHAEELSQIKDMGPATRVEMSEMPNEFMPRETITEPVAVDTQHVPPVEQVPAPPGPVDSGSAAAATTLERTTLFEMNGQRFATAGVTKDAMLALFKLCPQVDRKKGKGYAKTLLADEFQVATRSDLTSEAAERYRVRLTEILEG